MKDLFHHKNSVLFLCLFIIVCENANQPVQEVNQLHSDLKRGWLVDAVSDNGSLFWRYKTDYISFSDSEVTLCSIYDSCVILTKTGYTLKGDTITFQSTNPAVQPNQTITCGWAVPTVNYTTYADGKFVFYLKSSGEKVYCVPVNNEFPYPSWSSRNCGFSGYNFWYDVTHGSRKLK